MNNAKISISSLLLSAGLGRRMKNSHKLLLPLKSEVVIIHTAREILKAKFDEVIVITGFHAEDVLDALSSFPFHVAHNAHYETGMHSSIRRGLKAMSEKKGFFAVCLADQPLLKSSDYELLIEAARNNPEAKLIHPEFEGKRGQPVFISKSLREEILAHPDDDKGCAYLFKKYESLAVAMKTDACLIDLDTQEDYDEVLKRIENE
jgi:molybdenum cofactor cytidylyltransferase